MGPRSYGWLGTKPGLDLICPPALLPWKQSLHTKHVCFFTTAYPLQSMVKSAKIQHFLTWEPVVGPYCPPYRISHLTFKIQPFNKVHATTLLGSFWLNGFPPLCTWITPCVFHSTLSPFVYNDPIFTSLRLPLWLSSIGTHSYLCSLMINATLLCTKWPAPVDVCWVFHVGLPVSSLRHSGTEFSFKSPLSV